MKSNLKVGLTGGIGSGKSTCAKMFASLGVTIHEADDVAKYLLTENLAVIAKCQQYFGNKIIKNHAIDRKLLRQIIFNNNQARNWLNHLLHPLIYTELMLRASVPVKCYHILVVPLLFESNNNYGLNKVITVSSKFQAERAAIRDNVSTEDIQRILASQTNDSVRVAKSDFVILNNGEDLMEQIQQIHQIISG